MSEITTIGSLNLCLGLRSKKETVKKLIVDNKIDILCLQETEIPVNYTINLLTFKGYAFENEINDVKSRCGIYISNNLSHVRRCDLEVPNMHIMIIDINDKRETRVINMYRPFTPPNDQTQKQFFDSQLLILKNNITSNTIVLGDLNLDQAKILDLNYSHKNYFNSLIENLEPHNLIQMVNFPTWSRVINNMYCSSIIDHVYIKDPTLIRAIYPIIPPFGDHCVVVTEIKSKQEKKPNTFRRNWSKYNKAILIEHLNKTNWQINHDCVQSYWNCLESKLIEITDLIAPLENQNHFNNSTHAPPHIKNKINKRNRLSKKLKSHLNPNSIRNEIKSLNKDIKSFFHKTKAKSIRKTIIPGNSKSLWDAVKKAKDLNTQNLPDTLFLNKIKQNPSKHASTFADFFSNKVKTITNQTNIDPGVYNGFKKVDVESNFFMTETDILECMKSIKPKNCEGYDRIPQRILSDGAETLITPFTGLFHRIYHQQQIPQQWSVAKVIPIHKKGLKCDIENYRPIANLCSSSKIFEKLILKRMMQIETLSGIDLTGKQQHGFKRNRSTTTLSLQLQSLIARALDDDNHALMASIDLSAAFDVVNIDVLMVRLKLVGLPDDVIALIEVWLRDRLFYVDIADQVSFLHEINTGTIQGSILGPILYAIYVAPLFDLEDLSNFADDNFILSIHKDKQTAVTLMESKLKIITKWLKDSGLKVNEEKTELTHFYRKDTPPVMINVNNINIVSKDSINVLGITFDSKLTWAKHIATQINKANKALHAIKMIKKYFNFEEILSLLTSNFYSVLYYNSEVWHIPKLKPALNQLILSASANALKLSQRNPDFFESFVDKHKNCNRATPKQMIIYKHAILAHKLYNQSGPRSDWIDLNFDQILTSRQKTFQITRTNKYKVGNNLLSSRLSVVNNMIELNDFNLSLASFKIKYKNQMLK